MSDPTPRPLHLSSLKHPRRALTNCGQVSSIHNDVAHTPFRADVTCQVCLAKFQVGDRVRIFQLLNPAFTSEALLGKVDIISEIDALPNGEFNYQVGPHYMHEAELEAV